MELGLRGKKALVTGASKGIGRASAEALAAEGVDVVLVARTKPISRARAKIAGDHNVEVQCTIRSTSPTPATSTRSPPSPGIDILVNNAGAIPGGDLPQVTEARWREAWNLKVFGYINMTRRFYALMARGQRGSSSTFSARRENPDFYYIAGSTGNASLMAFTKALGGTAPATASDRRRQPRSDRDRATDRPHRSPRLQDFGDPERWRGMVEAATPSAAPPRPRRSPSW